METNLGGYFKTLGPSKRGEEIGENFWEQKKSKNVKINSKNTKIQFKNPISDIDLYLCFWFSSSHHAKLD